MPTPCGQKGTQKFRNLLPLFGLLSLSLVGCEFQTQSGNYKVSASQTRQLKVALVSPQPSPNAKQPQPGKAAPAKLKKKPLPSPSPSEETVAEASPSPEVSPSGELIAQNEFDGGYDPWADPNYLGVAPSPSASPSEDMALLDREKKDDDLKMGTVTATEGLSAEQTEDQLAKYEQYLRSLTDAKTGEPLYPAPEGTVVDEQFNDVAAQKAAELVRDQIPFDAFKAVYERMATIEDMDVNHMAEQGAADYRIFRGVAAVDKAQEFAQRKLDLARFESTLQYVQNLKDHSQRYVMSVETAVQISIEMVANANFNLDAFAGSWETKVATGSTPSIPTISTCLNEIGVGIDWGKVPAIGTSLLASQNLN